MLDYICPSTVEEALASLEAWGGKGRIVAGGTDLLPDIRKGRIDTHCLVDITRIDELQRIEFGEDWVTLGAAVTFGAIRRHAFLQAGVHALVEAAASVGAWAIQNAATWVGNLIQAMPAADGAIVALALDAEAYLVTGEERRWERVEDLFAGPGLSRIDPCREIVTHLRFPVPADGTGTAWRRVARRSSLVLPILNCAARVQLGRGVPGRNSRSEDQQVIEDVAIALGPVAPRPHRARTAEALLRGASPSLDRLRQAAQAAQREARPRTSVMRASKEYRLEILPSLVEDALVAAVDRARDDLRRAH